jgi:hypothetical protein
MSVWLCLPSAKPDGGTIPLWKEKGYKVAVWRDPGARELNADLIIQAPYKGYYFACNRLMRDVFMLDPACNWVVCAGDDTLPDERNPEEIARECEKKFLKMNDPIQRSDFGGTFGVMQPTGDPASDGLGRTIERSAGSPWIGREFAQRAYGGKGPYFEGYFHMGGDEELKLVAEKLGVYWPRPDVTHLHMRWDRDGDHWHGAHKQPPVYMDKAYGPEEWANYQRVFGERKAAGFPGCEPL